MKILAIMISFFVLFTSLCFGGYVKGYTRKDGTYVRPHYRSNPDSYKSNNYGKPSAEQKKEYENYSTLPTYKYDQDGDGTLNKNDADDDNDGVKDENE